MPYKYGLKTSLTSQISLWLCKLIFTRLMWIYKLLETGIANYIWNFSHFLLSSISNHHYYQSCCLCGLDGTCSILRAHWSVRHILHSFACVVTGITGWNFKSKQQRFLCIVKHVIQTTERYFTCVIVSILQ